MPQHDRLSALMNRFTLTVRPFDDSGSQLKILCDGADRKSVLLAPSGIASLPGGQSEVFSARVDWGGISNPLFAGLPDFVCHAVEPASELDQLIKVLCAEHIAQRCGVASVLNRMAEIVMVKLMRALIEDGAVKTGVLAGLADKRLSRTLVALHEMPGKTWTNADMAHVAGLSVSRFSELFREAVGVTPSAYLRQWRFALARQDLVRGDRVDAVARRYGYGSSEALNHMFRRMSGATPISARLGG
ncbi:AraC family transcriptional regulator [Thalassococcus sp. S3]|uniref:AraC family transcriptional regulator n=1 Tax=Thalassococcus sp. S3 TaxID=2017482 RepID=UPI0010241675|nr:AraC family transcriptional regulator [Thalassococcus sp. S3]QBF30079.1 cupin [Thalassococcus sp. S3]